MESPRARRIPHVRTLHGDRVVDEYAWLRDASDEVEEHLAREGEWAAARCAHLGPLVEHLFEEATTRHMETDLSVPQIVRHQIDGREDAYWYYQRTLEGQQYPVMSRLPIDTGAPPDPWAGVEGEEVMFDGNREADGSDHFALGQVKVSPDGRLLAWCVDLNGDEFYDVHVWDLATGVELDRPVAGIVNGVAWDTSDGFFYLRADEAHRPGVLWRHRIGSDPDTDERVMDEPDPVYRLGVRESRDRRWVLVTARSGRGNETWIRRAGTAGPFRRVAEREPGLTYHVEVAGDRLVIVHNHEAPDYELAQAPLEGTTVRHWVPILPHRAGTRILAAAAYRDYIVVTLRRRGIVGLHVITRARNGALGASEDLQFDDEVYTVDALPGPNYDDAELRLNLTTMTTPPTLYAYSVRTREMRKLKSMIINAHPRLGAFDEQAYVTRRLWATSRDGTQVPITVVMKADVPADGTAPCVLYGYGAYEFSIEPVFDVMRLSFLDRGFVFAIAHVRGGGELGRDWHHAGSGLLKHKGVEDFLAAAHHLIDERVASPERLGAQGASAGGLLVGAAMNAEPGLFRAVHLDVPYVDPVTTGSDPSLPLTVKEWSEWGNPLEDAEAYAAIKAYSPYENVHEAMYPAVLVTASLNDARVPVGEGAKLVARLRERATNGDDRPILLHVGTAGHAGVTGRDSMFREEALRWAWLMDQLAPEVTAADDELSEQEELARSLDPATPPLG